MMFWGRFAHKHYFLLSSPQKALPYTETRALSPHTSLSILRCDLELVTRVQKERAKSTPKFAIFADPLPVARRQPNFGRGVVTGISFLALIFRKSAEKCGSCGGCNFGLPFDKAHGLYNSLLLPHKP